MCVALYTQYFPESCEKKSQAFYSGGIRTHDLCNSRAVSYQLDHRDCPVARVYMGKNQKLIFFIPDANLTSIKSFAVPAAKT